VNRFALKKPLLLGALMLAAAGITIAATPAKRMADMGPKVNLEKMIPESFGRWKIDRSIVPVTVAPDVQAKLDKLYNQTLARTYIDESGRRVMLSIAYGGDQSDAMRAHRPEVCYTAQGFNVVRVLVGQLVTKYGVLPVRRMVAINGARHEPITYWIVVGDQIAVDGLGQKLAQLRYGLIGTVPDGMLIRVSSIDRNDENAFYIQSEFLTRLLGAVEASVRVRIAGGLNG